MYKIPILIADDGDEIVNSEVDWCIKARAPKCPAGGTYTYGTIGEDPRVPCPATSCPEAVQRIGKATRSARKKEARLWDQPITPHLRRENTVG